MPVDLFGDPPPRPQGGAKNPRSETAKQNAKCSVTKEERLWAVVSDPRIYALASRIPEADPDAPGRPGEFPLFVYLLFNALTAFYQSARATAANLAKPSVWNTVREGVAVALGQHVADSLPDHGPTRNQWQHNRKRLITHLDVLLDGFREIALEQAMSQGLLDPAAERNWSSPDLTQIVVGDGTIPRSPVKAQSPTSVDPKTGELRHHRIDPGSGEHTEGGEGGTRVFGPKFVFVSARSAHYHERVILDLRYQKPRHPGGEASLATDSILDLAAKAAGLVGVAWDLAMRGTHRNAIAKAGLLMINKQHRGAEPQTLEVIRGEDCYHDLWSVGGRVAQRTLTEDGTAEYIPIHITRLERRSSTDSYRWYHLLTLPCQGHVPHQHRVRLDQTEDDTQRGFNRAEHLRQIPPGTATFSRLYGYRPDAESLNALLDATWRNSRIIAYGAARQTLAVLGFAHTQNAIARHAYLSRTSGQVADRK